MMNFSLSRKQYGDFSKTLRIKLPYVSLNPLGIYQEHTTIPILKTVVGHGDNTNDQ